MGKLKKIINEKPRALAHKLSYVGQKKLQKYIDCFSTINKNPHFKIVNNENHKKIWFSSAIESKSDLKDKCDILNRSFYWLGMQGKSVQPNLWNVDFLSSYIWDNSYFQNIVTVDQKNSADVKIPWELSRLQHLTRLSIIYSQTKESCLLEFVIDEIKSWIKNNPYKYSVNWTCAMEVSIRAVNLILIALIIPDELFKNCSFVKQFVECLMLHGLFIEHNLETYDEHYNNHYLSDLLGLQWIGLFCDDYLDGKDKRRAQKWYRFAEKGLVKESYKQVFPDGTDYESSIAYHRFVTDLFNLSLYIDNVYDKKPSVDILNHTKKMIFFLEKIRMPNGNLPMIGDSDDGRILIFDNYSEWNKSKADYIFEYKEAFAQGDLILSKNSIPLIDSDSYSFEDSGYYLLRNDNIYCFTHCGPLSLHGHGGHSHNDQLAVVLAFEGESFVVDSGTGTYSGNPELRNYFRSTKAHSTLEVIGIEQNEIIKNNLFMMAERSFSRCLGFNQNTFSGQHNGYEEAGIVHRRNIQMTENNLIIRDYVLGEHITLNQKWRLNYILDSDVVPNQISKKTISLRKNGVEILLCSNTFINIETTIISKAYGTIEETYKISTLSTNIKYLETKFVLGGK